MFVIFLVVWCFLCFFQDSLQGHTFLINWVYGHDMFRKSVTYVSVSEPDDGYCSPFFNTSTVSNVTFGLVSSEWNTLSLTFFETQNALPITFPNYFSYGFSFDELSMNCVWFQLLSFAHVTFEVIALLTYPDTFQGLTCYFFSVSKVQPKSFVKNLISSLTIIFREISCINGS